MFCRAYSSKNLLRLTTSCHDAVDNINLVFERKLKKEIKTKDTSKIT